MRFSKNIASLVPSATLAISARAKKMSAAGESVINLSAGEPSFLTPDVAIEGGLEYVRSGKAGYPPTPGIPGLRNAVASYVNRTTAHTGVDPSNVLVSAGVKQALFNACFCLFEKGDEVLVPSPYWPTYLATLELAGATPVVVPTSWEDGFRLDVSTLERLRTPTTRGLFLNSPSNPSGDVYDRDLMAEIAAWAGANDVWIISDEIYRRLYYEGESAPSIFDVPHESERVLHLDGISKAFSMPGWRIGYAVAPVEVIQKMSALQSQTTSGAAGPSQHAAAAVLSSPQRDDIVRDFRDILRRRRDTAVEALSGVDGLELRVPAGAIYLYVRLTETSDSMSVAEQLLVQEGVATIPGEPFGTPGFLRLNYAVSDEELADGLARIKTFFS
ncbi:MAG: pyridoxal phosphate-dependent aminotransferase [Gemmatimonadetes bacterium]|nr:pyridoxal phosphate-dependent aminotransferase [Gemmatimonadota bacterium]